ncbi:unnamed protein product [Zymoseptoria tritici ST99CH_3D7]|uniref:Uncharacterized protein n=1 Tax=Zymoseptoria tritici (strain ST99CH_3D7) TaxID=1276538 RepID=A0A1X7RMY6_ZYMT9|nr:unnamed protein product [Zymoseptoria tritici ST99CH_3D7]
MHREARNGTPIPIRVRFRRLADTQTWTRSNPTSHVRQAPFNIMSLFVSEHKAVLPWLELLEHQVLARRRE